MSGSVQGPTSNRTAPVQVPPTPAKQIAPPPKTDASPKDSGVTTTTADKIPDDPERPSDPDAGGRVVQAQANAGRQVAGEQQPKSRLSQVGNADQLFADYKAGKISPEEFERGIRDFYARCHEAYAADRQDAAKREVEEFNNRERAYSQDMSRRNTAYQGEKAKIDRAAGTRDDKVRNLRITQSYHELSEETRDLIGADGGANWATWATWASKQAGSTIRGEDARPLRGAVKGLRMTGLAGMAAEHLFNRQSDSSSGAVARGNRKVYEEVAPCFARFNETFRGDTAADQRKLDDMLRSREFSGKPELRDAFTNYHRAMFENDKDKKQELMLLGNLQIGLYEQRRLQPEIESAIPYGTREICTSTTMSLGLANERVDLGSDVPKWHGNRGASFNRELSSIQNPELRAVLSRVDKTPNSLQGSGAEDWTVLDDRMNYIADLFRSRHSDPSLFNAPFSGRQESDIAAGRLPNGPL